MKNRKQIPRVFILLRKYPLLRIVTLVYSLTLSSLKYQGIGNLGHVFKATRFCRIQRLVFFFGFVKQFCFSAPLILNMGGFVYATQHNHFSRTSEAFYFEP